MDKILGISRVIGVIHGKAYLGTVKTFKEKAAEPGKSQQETERKREASQGVARYGALLNNARTNRRAKSSSEKLEPVTRQVELRYKRA